MIKKFETFKYKVNESVSVSTVNNFLIEFGFFISMNLSQVTKMGIDDNANRELESMMKSLRSPIINGKNYSDIIKDGVDMVSRNSKMISPLLLQISKFINYIEPRIKKYVKDCDTKDKWINKIEKLKTEYKQIVN